MYRLKKIDILSLAYTLTLFHFILGILIAILMSISKAIPKLAEAFNPNLLNLKYYQLFIIYPPAYAVGGFLTGLLIGVIYNFVAKKTRGVAIELVSESPKPKKSKDKSTKKEDKK